MSSIQLPLPAGPHHRNQQLFSDYYLDTLLPQRGDWQMLSAAAEAAKAAIQAIFAGFTPSKNEAQTEHELVRPILTALGHTFEVQAPLATAQGARKPDYILYRDIGALNANKGAVLDEARLAAGALAVGEAKYWERPLDVALADAQRAGDPFDNRNPSYQIAFYMLHSGVTWGILTNGRLWRLYHRDTSHKLDRYYEVDLPALLASEDPRAFLYFYGFFRRAAFDPGPLALTALLQASRDYAAGVSETLKAQVYEALRHLAQGFLDTPDNRLAPDAGTLKAIYGHSLIVLYRLLFVFYAEARGLLPVAESELYRGRYSLYAIARDVARDLRSGVHLLPTSTTLWPRLRELFHIIDAGSPPLHVATFNGGLFDPHKHAFLEEHTVGDAHLQAAIDRLARVDGQFIDYRDLAERHLGTIYEGLLEYHLALAPDPSPSQGGGQDGGRWTVDLENDKGERHATGSYYTPDYIVKYIVEQAVGPALTAAVTGKRDDRAKIEAVLGVNVLDAAMGSGHFLVEATEYIARFLVDLGVVEKDKGQKPNDPQSAIENRQSSDLAYWKRRVAQSCIYGVDLNPLAVDLAKLSLWLITAAQDRPLSFLDHHLRAGNSLVGARLADLSQAGPGARAVKERKRAALKTQQAEAAGQIGLFAEDDFRQSMSLAVGSLWLIEDNPAQEVAQVKEQEQLYAGLRRDFTERYARLADLATANRFGLGVDATLWGPLAEYAGKRGLAAFPRFDAWLAEADALAQQHRFFHWELEFPEVFFDRHGQPLGDRAGFHAVIGNPPYVRQEQVASLKPYFAAAHQAVYDGIADLYVYFYHQGLELLQTGGRLSYIVTNKWLRAGYGEALRSYFASTAHVEQIVDFGHAPIFPDADTFPCVIVLQKPTPEAQADADAQTEICLFPREALGQGAIGRYVREHSYRVPMRRFGAAPWSLEPSDVDALMAKIRRAGVSLAEYAGIKAYYGLKTGLNEAFLVDTPTKERLIHEHPAAATIIQPYLRGQDIKRWTPEWARLWMILLKSSENHDWPWNQAGEAAEDVFARAYPSLYRYFKPMEDRLRRRQDKGRFWWELRSCAYYEVFEGPKIIHTDIAWRSQFALSDQSVYVLNTAYVWPTADLYLLTVVNSPLLWAFMWRNAMHGKDEALRLIYSFAESLPIAPPTDALRAEIEPATAQLIATTVRQRAIRDDVLAWLRVEFGVESPGQRLDHLAALDEVAFVEEVRGRRPKSAPRLTPAALHDLRAAYQGHVPPLRMLAAEAARLEHRLATLVNVAYGLTSEEVDLLWRTAPPRMPGTKME